MKGNVEYIIKVIEPEKEYIKRFEEETLDIARQSAQAYLWSCPEGTQYIYVQTKVINE